MDKYMVQKLWSAFLTKKMATEMGKYRHLEDAFQKIRTSTGNSDVQELVNKFVTREATYSQLLATVGSNEKHCEVLRKMNDEKEELLHSLRIANQDSADDGKPNNKQSEELMEIQNEINVARKELEIINNRRKNVHLVCDQVSGWSRKTAAKLNKIVLDGTAKGGV